MANSNIFGLTELIEADVAENDVLLIGDLSTTGTKKVLKSALFKKLTTGIWEAGVSTDYALIQPAQLAAAISALATGGPWTLLGTYEPTSGSIVEITDFNLTDYDDYMLDIRHLSGTLDALMTMQASNDGGLTWVTTGSLYEYVVTGASNDATPEFGGSASGRDDWLLQQSNGVASSSNVEAGNDGTGYNALLSLNGFSKAADHRITMQGVSSWVDSGFDLTVAATAYQLETNTNVDALRISLSTGTFVKGRIRLYGVNKT